MMKQAVSMSVGLMLLATAPAGNAVVVFSDNAEGDTVGLDSVADIGSYADPNPVFDPATAGIPANPSGGDRFIQIRRTEGDTLVGLATEVASLGNKPVVHFELDIYIAYPGSGYTYADFQMVTSTSYGSPHPVTGTAPHITVSNVNAASNTMPEVRHIWNDDPAWHEDSLGMAVPVNEWHKYELDYTIGDATSMFITVDGGTPVNIPQPWGYDAYGDPVGAAGGEVRTLLDEIHGVMVRPGGSAPRYFADNLVLTFVPEPATGVLVLGGALVLFLQRRRRG